MTGREFITDLRDASLSCNNLDEEWVLLGGGHDNSVYISRICTLIGFRSRLVLDVCEAVLSLTADITTEKDRSMLVNKDVA